VLPFCTEALEGVTLTLVTVGVGVVTVTDAEPDFDGSTVEVAVTVKLVAVSDAPTDKMPEELMLDAEPPETDHITVCAGLFVPETVALNACVFPFCTEALEGVTLTLVTVGVGVVTETDAEPDLDGSTVEVAVTVRLVAVSDAPTLRTPDELILEADPPDTDHVTV
jgi:hypothetical protein